MQRLRSRKSIVLICLVAAVGGLLPLGSTAFTAVLTTLWVVCPVVIVVIRRAARRCDEQPVSLLSLLLARAPPVAA